MYRYLLVDNDDTLMDFRLAEQHALGDVLRRHGIPDSADTLALYHGINQALWKALERGETTQAKLKVERFRQLGIEPGDIRSIQDITKLPFTYKQDLRDNYPDGLFAAPMDDIVRIHASSGTTGRQTVVGYTRNDLKI